MPIIEAMNCPVCGAPLTEKASHCLYCGSLVAIRVDHEPLNLASIDRALVNEKIGEFRQKLKADPRDPAAHYGLGLAYFNMGLLADAVDEMRQAAKLMPENPEIRTQFAVMLAEQGIMGVPGAEKQAWEEVGIALRLRPNDEEALLLKARLQSDRGDWRAALATLKRGLPSGSAEVKQRAATLLLGQAAVAAARGEWIDVKSLWKEAMAIDPEATGLALREFCREHQDVLLGRPKYSQLAFPATGKAGMLSNTKLISGVVIFGLFVLSMVMISVSFLETPAVIVFLAMFAVPFIVPRLVRRKLAEASAPEFSTVRQIQRDPGAFFTGTLNPGLALVGAEYVAAELGGKQIAAAHPVYAGATPQQVRRAAMLKTPSSSKRPR